MNKCAGVPIKVTNECMFILLELIYSVEAFLTLDPRHMLLMNVVKGNYNSELV